MSVIGVNKSKGAIGQPGSANYVPPVLPQSPLQNQNTVIYVPSAGPAGKPGPQILSGTGEPGNDLTGSTLVGDYYLDGTSGNFWKRTTYTGNIGPTTLILAGNVQWEKVAALKGAAGPQRIDENIVIELNQDIKSETDNVPRFKITADAFKAYKNLILESDTWHGRMSFDLTDPDDDVVKQAFEISNSMDSNNAEVVFKVSSGMALGTAFMEMFRFNGERRTIKGSGSGFILPTLTAAQIAEFDAVQPITNGTLVYNSTTDKIQQRTALGWKTFSYQPDTVITSSDSTITLPAYPTNYVWAGNGVTWNLPSPTNLAGLTYIIYNRGAGNITVSGTIMENGSNVSSTVVLENTTCSFLCDGFRFLRRP